MKFSIRKLFSRKSKKEAAPAASATEAAPEKPVAQPATPPANGRLARLAPCKQPEGYYLINLDVAAPTPSRDGHSLQMVKAPETGLMIALLSRQYLAGCKTIAVQAEEHIKHAYQLDIGHIYYKRKDADFFFDGDDQLLGLPPGDGFQLVLVPKGCDWKPDYVPPALYGIPGTSTILQHPATLLPQFQPQVQYPIIFVNGYDISRPVLPEMARAEQKPAPKEKPEAAPETETAVQPTTPPPAPKP